MGAKGARMLFWLRDFASNLLANFVAGFLGPADMIGYLIGFGFVIWAAIGWHRRERAAKRLGMASWYFIAPCVLIAIIAVAGAAFGLGLRSASSPKTEPVSRSAPLTIPQNTYLKDVYIYAGQDLGKGASPQNPRFVAKFTRNGQRARFYVEDRYYPLGLFGASAWMRTPQVQLTEYKEFVANDPVDFPILTPFDQDGNKFWRWGAPNDKGDARTVFQNHADHQGRVVLIVDGEPPAYFYFIVNPSPPHDLPDIVGQWRFDFAAKWEAEDAAQK